MKALKTANFVLAIALFATTAHAQTAKGNWAYLGGDIGDSKYSALDQINAGNIKRLKIAWRTPAIDPAVRAENPQLVPSNNYQDAPLVFDGVMYISNQIGQAEARDPGTGKVIWRQANFPGDGPLTALRSSRGIAIWGAGASARIVTVRGPYLYLLDAKTGAAIPGFGDNGRVDMRANPKDLFYWRTPSPIVVNDVIVIGGQPIATGTADVNKASLAGDIRGYDVHSGKLLWTFHTVPHEGEPGTETWENESLARGRQDLHLERLQRRRTVRIRVCAPERAPQRLLRRDQAGRRPLLRLPCCPGRQDRQEGLALPDRASRPLGLRYSHAADPGRHQSQRPPAQGRHSGHQDRLCIRPRPSDRRTAFSDRTNTRSCIDHSRRKGCDNAADPCQAQALRQARHERRSVDRFHAGAARGSGRDSEPLCSWRYFHAAIDCWRPRRQAGHTVHARLGRWCELERRCPRSANGHNLRPLGERALGRRSRTRWQGRLSPRPHPRRPLSGRTSRPAAGQTALWPDHRDRHEQR